MKVWNYAFDYHLLGKLHGIEHSVVHYVSDNFYLKIHANLNVCSLLQCNV